MSLKELISRIPDFHALQNIERISIVAWHLHRDRGRETFTYDDLRNCFREIHTEPPNVGVYIPRMLAKRPPLVLRNRAGFRLSGVLRETLQGKYGDEPSTVAVSSLLAALPKKIDDEGERVFLEEAISCYKIGAYRAAIVMAWNLAFSHLIDWIMRDPRRIDKFNSGLAARFPKKSLKIETRDEFSEVKESEVIEVCRASKVLPKDTCDILRERLTRRNKAAHPSAIVIVQNQADDLITDLVNNVIKKLV